MWRGGGYFFELEGNFLNNNIILIEVPYWEKDNLECFLWNELIKYGEIVEVA